MVLAIVFTKRYRMANPIQKPKLKRFAIIVIAVMFALIAIRFLAGIKEGYDYNHAQSQNLQQSGFTVYAPPGYEIDSEYMRRKSDHTVPHARTSIATNLGEINVIQARTDSETDKLFMPPNRCDVNALYEYMGVLGKETQIETTVECRVVDSGAANGWTIMTPIANSEFGNTSPFAAAKGSTIILFQAYRSTGGEFGGSPGQAEPHVVDFLIHAQPVELEKL